jgi:hypothetical protein
MAEKVESGHGWWRGRRQNLLCWKNQNQNQQTKTKDKTKITRKGGGIRKGEKGGRSMEVLVPPGAPRLNSNSNNPSQPPPPNYNPNSNPNSLADNLSNLNLNRPPSMPNSGPHSSAPLPGFPSGSPPFSRPCPPPGALARPSVPPSGPPLSTLPPTGTPIRHPSSFGYRAPPGAPPSGYRAPPGPPPTVGLGLAGASPQAPSMRSLPGAPLQPTSPFSAPPQGVPPPPGSYGPPTWPRHPGQVMNIFHEDHIVGKLTDISNMRRAVFWLLPLILYAKKFLFRVCVEISLFLMRWHLLEVLNRRVVTLCGSLKIIKY